MDNQQDLVFQATLPVAPDWAGHLISRGIGRHPKRLMDHFVLIFVREGVLEIAEEGKAFSIAANQTLLLLPNRWHHGTKDYAPDLSFFWIHFSLQVSEETADSTAASGLFHVPQHTTVARPDYLAELFHRYIDDHAGNRQEPIAASLLMQLILSEVQRPGTARSSGSASVPAARAESFIRTNFHLPLTARIAADHVGCNPHYLSRVYRQSYGCTLTEAIQRTRIDYGCRLLLGSDLRVGEIAHACGMEDANYFHQLFKRRKGLMPSAYRRLHTPANINTE
ncbi:MAG: AraC family transcriptional regulator [Janthinobacterium lividum]